MKITRLCPQCKQQKKFASAWSAMFNEDYFDMKERVKHEDYIRAANELPEIHEKIEKLSTEQNKLEKALMEKAPDEYYELKKIHQDLLFQSNRLKYTQEKLTQ